MTFLNRLAGWMIRRTTKRLEFSAARVSPNDLFFSHRTSYLRLEPTPAVKISSSSVGPYQQSHDCTMTHGKKAALWREFGVAGDRNCIQAVTNLYGRKRIMIIIDMSALFLGLFLVKPLREFWEDILAMFSAPSRWSKFRYHSRCLNA